MSADEAAVNRTSGGLIALWFVATLGACLPPVAHHSVSPAEIETSLFLIGDAGEADPRAERGGVPLDSLTAHAAVEPQKSVIVYLGDNIYPDGIPAEGRAEWADSRRRLDAQVRAVPPGARGIFVPGNHDWGGEEPDGLYTIRRQERMIADLAGGRDVRMLPTHGCPGPATLDIGRLRFIALDTHWWLHEYIVRDSSTTCTNTMAGVTAELRRDVQPTGENRVVVVTAHHPLMTGGSHGGYCGITGPFRRFAGWAQDIMSASNKRMRDSIEAAFRVRRPLIFAAGHEHNMQVLRGGASAGYILVSGAGSPTKVSCAVRLRESDYTSPHRVGFMRVDILRERGVLLRLYRYSAAGRGGLAYSAWLEER